MGDPAHLASLAIQNAPDMVSVYELDGTLLYVSDACRTVLGYEPEDLVGSIGYEHIHPADHDFVAHTIHEPALKTGNVERTTYRLRRKDGTYRWFETRSRVIHRPEQSYIVAVRREITDDVTSADRMPLATASVGLDGRFLRVSPQLGDMLGRTRADLIGRTVEGLAHPDDRRALEAMYAEARAGVRIAWLQERRLTHLDGRVIWVLESAWLETDSEGSPLYVRSQLQDITAQKSLLAELHQSTLHDGLTGLPNRALFEDRVARAQAESRRSGSAVGVLFVDLDRFHVVNEVRGHEAGDRVLQAVARELTDTVERVRGLGSNQLVGRLSGDDFLILCEGLQRETQAVGLARWVCDSLDHPIYLPDGQEVFLGASVGVATDVTGMSSPGSLIADAEVAMRAAKDRGRGRIEVFDETLRDQAVSRLELDAGLRRAAQRGELTLWYQPLVRMSDQHITGVEALARWKHPEKGMISPLVFIPIAEETGFVVQLGEWALREACSQMRRWGAGDLTVAVNISPRHLAEAGLVEAVKSSLAESGTDPAALCLEVTESALMDDSEDCRDALRRLKDLGVTIAIDDFGTGHSSLNQLKRLPVDVVKIDRSFVSGLGRQREDAALVQAVITMAHALDLRVVAEGVETPEQFGMLADFGCDVVQGFLLARPAPAEEAGALIAGAATITIP